jgi:hypothetical protein
VLTEQIDVLIQGKSGGAAPLQAAQTLLDQGKSREAAAEFQKFTDGKLLNWGWYYPHAFIDVAHAAAMSGDTARAKKAYEDFFALWKDAEPGLPLLTQARTEYAALK